MRKTILILLVSLMPGFKVTLQDKQLEAFDAIEAGKAQYYLYGGAKGGGKSYLVRADEIYRRMVYPGTTGAIFRKTYPELISNHIRKFWQEYPFTREWWRESEKAIKYPNGSITEFKYLDTTNDVYNYQGIEFDDIALDEATQHEEEVFKVLKTSLRSDPKTITRNPGFHGRFLSTANPGGPGHGWVKRLYIDKRYNPEETASDYAFIAAKIYDNQIFLNANPQYLKNLQDLPEDLRRAYLDGDWEVFIGQFFGDWRYDIHRIEPIEVDRYWGKIFGLDWGFSPHPFHAGWYTQDFQGNVFKYRELEGNETAPQDVANQIVELSRDDSGLTFGVGDSQMWELNPYSAKKPQEAYSDKSIAETIRSVLQRHGMDMFQANKNRITGWTLLKTMLQWDAELNAQGRREFTKRPKYYVFSACPLTISAYPNMIHSKLHPEDMQKIDGDDPCDTDRYALMHIQGGIKPKPPMTHYDKMLKEVTKSSKIRGPYV
jgi:phage terminase large subunit